MALGIVADKSRCAMVNVYGARETQRRESDSDGAREAATSRAPDHYPPAREVNHGYQQHIAVFRR